MVERLRKAKILLGIKDNSKNELLSFIFESVEQKILNYCNREDFPKELEFILIEIVCDQYKQSDTDGGKVASVKRGDTQITYQQSNFNALTGSGGADFIKNYKTQLNRYRKVGTVRKAE